MKATKATIEGKITATSGIFNNCTIREGCTIGGCTINNDSVTGQGWSLAPSGASFTELTVGGNKFTSVYNISHG
jgi:hypothetical protein